MIAQAYLSVTGPWVVGILTLMGTVGSRIHLLRDGILKTSQDLFASRLGVTRGAVSNWERNKGIKTENLRLIAETFDISFDWLATGKGEPPTLEPMRSAWSDWPATIDVEETEPRAGGASFGFGDSTEMADAENGVTISADPVRDHWGIPASFVSGELRMSRNKARIIEVFGDSMYDPGNPGAPGSLFPGDRVIIDVGDVNPTPPGIFLVWDGYGLVLKMVEVVRNSQPARVRLKSRNPSYDPYEATEDEAKIIGRVRGRISRM